MRPIDADALRNEFKKFNPICYFSEWYIHCDTAFNKIKNAPTIDPESLLAAQWIPVTERLPKEHQPVLFCRKGGNVDAGCRIESGWWKSYGIKVKSVTHWMPLPKPPQEG